ncbi:MAG: phosphonate ABC transporter, permease protein PhnE, partial [Ensifer adhaerens]
MTTTTRLNPMEMDAIASRHPDLLKSSTSSRVRTAAIAGGVVAYLIFSWWFFSIGHVLGNANWGIAGTYLADWVSYEVRPEIHVAPDRTMRLNYQRNSPLGPNPNPDWVELDRQTVTRQVEIPASTAQAVKPKASSSFSFMAPGSALGGTAAAETQNRVETRTEDVLTRVVVTYDRSTRIEIADGLVKATHGGDTFVMTVDGADTVRPQGQLPAWATQKRPGEKIVLAFGATGWAEVEGDEVSVRNRFFGWANFLFDTNSPFFGKSYGEVVALITSGEQIDPTRSNLSLAWNNIL